MPHIRFRFITAQQANDLSTGLVSELAQVIQTPEENFTCELVATEFIKIDQVPMSFPFVEVLWFARPQSIQDQCAHIITEKIKVQTQSADVVVVFTTLERSDYYENGQHF